MYLVSLSLLSSYNYQQVFSVSVKKHYKCITYFHVTVMLIWFYNNSLQV